MDWLLYVLLGIGLAAACGFRVFVPLLVISIAALTVYLLVGVWPRSAEAVSEARAARLVMPLTRLVDSAAGVIGGLLPKDLADRLRDGHRTLRGTIEGIEDAIGTLEDVGDNARAYSEKAMEGAAVADSLARVVIPPEEGRTQ